MLEEEEEEEAGPARLIRFPHAAYDRLRAARSRAPLSRRSAELAWAAVGYACDPLGPPNFADHFHAPACPEDWAAPAYAHRCVLPPAADRAWQAASDGSVCLDLTAPGGHRLAEWRPLLISSGFTKAVDVSFPRGASDSAVYCPEVYVSQDPGTDPGDDRSHSAGLFLRYWGGHLPRVDANSFAELVWECWGLDEFAVRTTRPTGRRNYPVEHLVVPKGRPDRGGSQYLPEAGQTLPAMLRVAGVGTWDDLIDRTEAALARFPQEPTGFRLGVYVPPADWPEVRPVLVEFGRAGVTRGAWSHRYDGGYRPGFDPLARPAGPCDPPRRYPLFTAADEAAAKLLLQCDAVHAAGRSFLEFQTTEGVGLLEDVLTRLGGGYEVWDGPFEERWGELAAG